MYVFSMHVALPPGACAKLFALPGQWAFVTFADTAQAQRVKDPFAACTIRTDFYGSHSFIIICKDLFRFNCMYADLELVTNCLLFPGIANEFNPPQPCMSKKGLSLCANV